MPDQLKLCKHCKWVRRDWLVPTGSKCRHEKALRFDSEQLIIGAKPERRLCSIMRDRDNLCGSAGVLWEMR